MLRDRPGYRGRVPAGISLARAVVMTQGTVAVLGGLGGLVFVLIAVTDLDPTLGFMFLLMYTLLIFIPLIVAAYLLIAAGFRLGRMELWAQVTVIAVEAMGAALSVVSLAFFGGGAITILVGVSAIAALVGLVLPDSRVALAAGRTAGPARVAAGVPATQMATGAPAPAEEDATWDELVNYWHSLFRGRTSR